MDNYAINAQLPLWSFQFRSGSKVQVVTRKDIETKLIEKAFKENGFRARLIENPKAEIERLFNIELPEDLSIQVVEETADLSYVVIPHNPYAGVAESELKAAMGMGLEEVAEWVLDQQKRVITDKKEKNIQIVVKAWRDEAYKKMLMADPNLVIETELGGEIEGKCAMEALEESAENIVIVIPAMPDSVLNENEYDAYFTRREIVIATTTVSNPQCIKCFSF
jgi:hypothetical protein